MGRTGEAPRRVTRAGFAPAWSPDGVSLAFASENVELNPQNSEFAAGLRTVNVETGEVRPLTEGDAALPSWSPGGHRIAYTRRLGRLANADIWTIPAGGGEPTPVTSGAATDWNPSWSPDGRHLYFASNRGGSMNLWRIPIDERSGDTRGSAEPLTTPATSLAHVDLAADGRQVAYSSILVTQNIQKAGIDPRTGAVVGDPTWVTTGSRRWSSPDPSPDGEWVAFYSLTEPEGDLYVARSDGTGLRRVTGDSANDRVPRWSPDGEWIAFFSNRSDGLEAWAIRPDGSELRRLTYTGAGVVAWSPDGSRVAVSARDRLPYLMEADRSSEEQSPEVLPPPDSTLAPFRPGSWSADGEWLAGDIGYTDGGIVVYSFGSRSYERLTDFGQWPAWLPDGRRVLFVSGGNAFYVVDRVTKEVTEVLSVHRDVIGPPQLARDGRTVFFSRRVTESDIWLAALR
jgi:Tol biopolymer transport system component